MDFQAALQSPDSILELFRKYAVQPSDGVTSPDKYAIGNLKQFVSAEDIRPVKQSFASMLVKHLELVKSTTMKEQNAEYDAFQQKLVDKGKDLGKEKWIYVTNAMRSELRSKYGPTNTIRGKDTLMTMVYDYARATTTPCYFLPWDPMGGIVQLSIPKRRDTRPGGPQQPILFLTAALSGCSIFVHGTPQEPTVYHCGTQFNTPADHSSKHFWKEAMREIGVDPDKTDSAHATDYMQVTRGKQGSGQEMADKASKMFTKFYTGQLSIEDVNPWGAVFGVRTGDDWAFYLQENATITYTSATHADAPGGPKAEIRTVSRPIVLRQIFPGGGGEVKLLRRWRKLRA